MDVMTHEQIIKIVDATKDFSDIEKSRVARGLGFTECAIYCIEMEKIYGTKVRI